MKDQSAPLNPPNANTNAEDTLEVQPGTEGLSDLGGEEEQDEEDWKKESEAAQREWEDERDLTDGEFDEDNEVDEVEIGVDSRDTYGDFVPSAYGEEEDEGYDCSSLSKL